MAMGTEKAYMKLLAPSVNSATRTTGRSQCTVFACEISDSRGAAAARLLFGFTLDPCLGSTQVYRVVCMSCGFRSTGVYR